jgi:GNAT superfamily N-acetyltransferase
MYKLLPDNLILRSLSEGCRSDFDQLPTYYGERLSGDDFPQSEIVAWSQDLISGNHPTVTADDVWVVVDPTKEDQIVSATLLIPQVWRYEEIELPTGRVELVATHPDYRRRGLVRALMETAHERSAELGHIMQGITGIPYYYRQFGYAMAVDLAIQSTFALEHVPQPPKDYTPDFTLRPATEADIPKVIEWDAYMARSALLSAKIDSKIVRYNLYGRQPGSSVEVEPLIIVNQAGEGVGFVVLRKRTQMGILVCYAYVVGEESSYVATFDDVMRALRDYASNVDPTPTVIGFDSGIHPTLKTLIERTVAGKVNPRTYAWYLRVPDMAAFMRQIAPVLERRLDGSGANRYTGEFTISFFDQTGLRLKFERGKLLEAENMTGLYEQIADAGFPYHTFLNVVFGHRSYEQLQPVLPDVYCNPKTHALLDALFPLKRSWLLGLA